MGVEHFFAELGELGRLELVVRCGTEFGQKIGGKILCNFGAVGKHTVKMAHDPITFGVEG
ncbi:MAG: hypothetical protein G01um101416_1154 [Microgenomates group bacterium Gr01-1014_16]|nr:MAG: hypothetical protein G01um101416_1154 [Microgenomates group bacterium Gr01-1014_16]